jgi:hypothetical protein
MLCVTQPTEIKQVPRYLQAGTQYIGRQKASNEATDRLCSYHFMLHESGVVHVSALHTALSSTSDTVSASRQAQREGPAAPLA